ncbi:MAG TPA: hypothetical protein VF420_13240 [Casimicrobiaceae bacterium]
MAARKKGLRHTLARLGSAISKHARKARPVHATTAQLRRQLEAAKREIARLERQLESCAARHAPAKKPKPLGKEPRWVVYDKSGGPTGTDPPRLLSKSWAKTERQAFRDWQHNNPEHDGSGIRTLSWKQWKEDEGLM